MLRAWGLFPLAQDRAPLWRDWHVLVSGIFTTCQDLLLDQSEGWEPC